MIVYEIPKRFSNKWNVQLEWLKQFWNDGEETMFVSDDVVLVSNGKRLIKREADGGYAFAKFMQSSGKLVSFIPPPLPQTVSESWRSAREYREKRRTPRQAIRNKKEAH